MNRLGLLASAQGVQASLDWLGLLALAQGVQASLDWPTGYRVQGAGLTGLALPTAVLLTATLILTGMALPRAGRSHAPTATRTDGRAVSRADFSTSRPTELPAPSRTLSESRGNPCGPPASRTGLLGGLRCM